MGLHFFRLPVWSGMNCRKKDDRNVDAADESACTTVTMVEFLRPMIYLDSPLHLRRGEITALVVGWYAGETPCSSIRARTGGAEVACRLEDRPDVRQAWPDLFSTGFRCALDLYPAGTLTTDDSVQLEIVVDTGESACARIPADTGWSADLRATAPHVTAADLGLGLHSGDPHYRAYVGIPEDYDLTSAATFSLLTLLGLRQHHRLVDIGCGSLRTGRLLIPYLNRGNYLGLEPNEWLVRDGIRYDLGESILAVKQPRFLFTDCPAALDREPRSHFALANSIFSHAALDQVRGWLQHLARHLTVYGALAATYVPGDEDYAGGDWVYPACIRYRPDTMRAAAEGFGFRLVQLDWRHLHGQRWVLFAQPQFDLEQLAQTPLNWNLADEHR